MWSDKRNRLPANQVRAVLCVREEISKGTPNFVPVSNLVRLDKIGHSYDDFFNAD